jgi:hypothetical protein
MLFKKVINVSFEIVYEVLSKLRLFPFFLIVSIIDIIR